MSKGQNRFTERSQVARRYISNLNQVLELGFCQIPNFSSCLRNLWDLTQSLKRINNKSHFFQLSGRLKRRDGGCLRQKFGWLSHHSRITRKSAREFLFNCEPSIMSGLPESLSYRFSWLDNTYSTRKTIVVVSFTNLRFRNHKSTDESAYLRPSCWIQLAVVPTVYARRRYVGSRDLSTKSTIHTSA